MQTLTSPPTPPHLPSLDLPPAFGSSFQPVPPPPQPRTIDKSDIRPRNSYPFTQQQQHSPFQHGGGAGARWNGSERGTTAGLPLPSSMLTLPPGVTRQMASLLSADKFKQIVKVCPFAAPLLSRARRHLFPGLTFLDSSLLGRELKPWSLKV